MNFKSPRCVVFAQINDKNSNIFYATALRGRRHNDVLSFATFGNFADFVIYLRENYTTGRLEIHARVRDNISLVLESYGMCERFVDFVK